MGMTQTRTRRWIPVSLLAVAAMAGLAFAQSRGEDTRSLKGQQAPDVALKTLDGKDFSVASNAGKVLVIDFWATWCGPCKVTLPHINQLASDTARAEKGLVVVAVNLREDEAKVKAFLEQNKFTMPVPMDTKAELAKAFKVQGIPTAVVIGRDGKIAEVVVGSGQNEKLDSAIDKALEAK